MNTTPSPAGLIRQALECRSPVQVAAAAGVSERTLYRVLKEDAWPSQARTRNGLLAALMPGAAIGGSVATHPPIAAIEMHS